MSLLFTVLSALSCFTGETKREHGIEAAKRGDWKRAVKYLEKYVLERIDEFPSALSLSENPFLRNEVDMMDYREFLEATFYLLSSYLGLAGFDQLNIADHILEAIQTDVSQSEGKRKVAKIIANMFEGYDNRAFRVALFYAYSAREIAETVLYGRAKPNQTPNIFEKLFEPEEKELYEVVRLIKTIEYVYGEILIWISVIEGMKLRQVTHYIESERTPSTSLPSYCCIFGDREELVRPYVFIRKNLKDIIDDVYGGINQLLYGTMLVDRTTEFGDLATRYGEIVWELFSKLERSANRSCLKWSSQLTDVVQRFVEVRIQRFFESFPELSTYSVMMEAREKGGLWVCPTEELYGDFIQSVMCSYKVEIDDLYGKYGKFIFEQLYGSGVTFEVIFRVPFPEIILDCSGKDVSPLELNRTVTLVMLLKDGLTREQAVEVAGRICSSEQFRSTFDAGLFFRNLLVALEMLSRRALEEIFDSRGEPEICGVYQ